tara:strand:+ start:11574 stop:12158 length:585 start_codon:yes stop_codon:yes gene_type:complete
MSKEKMIKWYNDSLKKYGENDFRSLTWSDLEGKSAKYRYKIINDIESFKNKDIIEFGCGWGSFFDFGFTCNSYLGIDINSNLINIAKSKHKHSFYVDDCLTFKSNKTFDLAISSGVAGNQGGPADHPIKLKQFLLNMKNHASKVIVNFPSTWATIRSKNIEYFSPSSTLEIALSVTENVQLIHKTKFDFLLILE